jgi:hypothetical protein
MSEIKSNHTNDNIESNANYLPLVLTEKIKSKGYIQRFVKAIIENHIIVELNHPDSKRVIVSPINYTNWVKTTDTFTTQVKRKGISTYCLGHSCKSCGGVVRMSLGWRENSGSEYKIKCSCKCHFDSRLLLS